MKGKKQNKKYDDLIKIELEKYPPIELDDYTEIKIEELEKELKEMVKEMEIAIDLDDYIVPFDIESIKPMTKEEIEELEKELTKELEKSEKELKELLKSPPLYDIDEFIKEVSTLDLEFEK